VQHRAQKAVDAVPGMPEARVGGVHFAFGVRGSRSLRRFHALWAR
jgi:hypothetical protein